MRAKKLLIILAVLFIAKNAFCKGQQEGGNQSTTVRGGDNLFARGGTGSLTINNQASFDVIIFAGKISNNNVLGGIRAGDSRKFDISKLRLPEENGSFLVRAASSDTYHNKNFRITEDDVLYTGLVVYDLNNPRDAINLNIYAGINKEQNTWIYVSNNSRFVLELRLDSPIGEQIATLAPFAANKRIYLKSLPGGLPYQLFATYVYVDHSSHEIITFFENNPNGLQRIPNESINQMIFSGPVGYNWFVITQNENGNHVHHIQETAYMDKLEDLRITLLLGD